MPINKIQNYLLYLYVLTSVFSQYPKIYLINNLIMLLFIASSFLTKKSSEKNSSIFIYYSVIVVISIFNQIFYFMTDEFEYTSNYLTLPMILLLLYSVNRIKITYSYEILIIANIIFLPILFLLGGFGTINGRINTDYLTANLQGMLVFFGFMVSFHCLIKDEKKLLYGFLLASTVLYMVMSGSRQNLLLISIGLLFIAYPILINKKYFKRNNLIKRLLMFLILFVGSTYIVQNSIANLSKRFEGHNILKQVSTQPTEYSAAERLSFIKTSIKTSQLYLFGVGHGNTKSALKKYGDNHFKVTNNSHSLFAELLFTTGFFGLIIWLFILRKLIKLCLRKTNYLKYGYIPIFFILATFIIPLIFIKVFWLILVVLEKQISTEEKSIRI